MVGVGIYLEAVTFRAVDINDFHVFILPQRATFNKKGG
jgi:hypothetical protein